MKLDLKGTSGDLGVIVARFQTPVLTEGHKSLIETVRARHPKFLIMIGVAKVIPSRQNPLDYLTRYQMIAEQYPGTLCMPIFDTRSDKLWSENIDKIIRNSFPHEKVVLYGSRDSFIKHYFGKFATVELDEILGTSATMAREAAFHANRNTSDFRAGICYVVANQYRKNVLAVDVAIVDYETKQVLLGQKKEDEGLWRFIGGHVNVGHETAEAAGRREVHEETGAEVSDMDYIGSTPIVDWRYTNNVDGMFTIFFVGRYRQGPICAGDDIDKVEWSRIMDKLNEEMFVPEHRILFDMFSRKFGLRGVNTITEPSGDIGSYQYKTVDGQQVITTPVPRKYVEAMDASMLR